ncbi:MAG: JmjC domain-containing protein [Sphingomonadaceae bacterium]
MVLDNFDAAAFLRDYWQKKPLLIRQGWAEWRNPLAPDELAGLACEDGVESRLITQARARWEVEAGPIPEVRFGKLGKAPWTLLVQAVDHHVPAVAALLDAFRFIPNWRVDDVMVSYATDGGGVGPHFDQYDVFLVQGLGQRRWQLGGFCDADTALLPHDDLRLLEHFEPEAEWLLEPGDMLYLPPRIAHNGVAVGDDCMTYSIGFRAPARSELIAHYCDHLLAELDDDDRFNDPDLPMQPNPGEISNHALVRLRSMIADQLADEVSFARWFGSYTSQPKYPEIDWSPETQVTAAEVAERLGAGGALRRNPASRFSYVRQAGGGLLLFVDGAVHSLAGALVPLAEALCASAQPAIGDVVLIDAAAIALLTDLLNEGSLAFADDV